MILDAVEYLVECWCRRQSGKLRRQILLQRLTGSSGPADQHIMDFLGNVSDLHVRHACILHARMPPSSVKFCTTLMCYIPEMATSPSRNRRPGHGISSAIDQIIELLGSAETETANTSMRIPTALREAAAIAVSDLGIAPSTTALTTGALRATLEAVVMQAVLDQHYQEHPGARPNLADLAIATAELDGHPLASDPSRIRQAAAQIVTLHPDADAHAVLLWAEAQVAVPA